MSEATVPERRTQVARASRVRQYLRLAKSQDGHERHTLVFIGKATLAASVSWLIAQDVMAAQSPAFALFSALLIIQVTAYQSIREGLRYIVAVAAGVALQGALGLLTGSGAVTFTLVALSPGVHTPVMRPRDGPTPPAALRTEWGLRRRPARATQRRTVWVARTRQFTHS